jgi:hypothetical protein
MTSVAMVGILAFSLPPKEDVKGPKSGFWYYAQNDVRGDAPFKPNPSVLPSAFGQGESKSWKVDPKMLSKMKKLVALFEQAEPKPQYCHRMINIYPTNSSSSGVVSNPVVTLGTRLFLYDERGNYVPNGTPPGGYLPGSVATLLINGASTPNEGLKQLFPVVEGLTYIASKGGPMLPEGLLRAVPPSEQGYFFNSLNDPNTGASLKKVDVWPKGLRDSAQYTAISSRYITDKESRAKGSLPPWYTESSIDVLWFSNQKFPLHNFISRKTLFDLMEIKSRLAFEKVDSEMKQRVMPQDEKKKNSEQNYQSRQRRAVQISLDLVKRLRETFKDSLNETAIIHPSYFVSIGSGTAFTIAEEEFPVNKGGSRKYPLSGLFVDDPSKGYRIGSPVKSYYENLAPGEIRSLQLRLNITHQVPDFRDFGKPAAAGNATWFADVTGNVFNALQYAFPWKKVAELVGP